MRSWMHSRKAIAVGAIATATVVGGATMAAANRPGPSAGTSTSATSGETGVDTETNDGPDQGEKGDQGETPIAEGTIKAPPEAEDAAEGSEDAASEKAADAAEQDALAQLATVDRAAASSAAIAEVPGTAGTTTLEEEDGYVVYQVEITKADESVVEVVLDAGNASVLGQEASDGDGPEGSDD